MKNLFIILFLLSAIPSVAEEVYPHNNESFANAKKLMKKVYYDNQFSFYCGCAYEYKQIKGKEKTVVDAASCGYVPRKNA